MEKPYLQLTASFKKLTYSLTHWTEVQVFFRLWNWGPYGLLCSLWYYFIVAVRKVTTHEIVWVDHGNTGDVFPYNGVTGLSWSLFKLFSQFYRPLFRYSHHTHYFSHFIGFIITKHGHLLFPTHQIGVITKLVESLNFK